MKHACNLMLTDILKIIHHSSLFHQSLSSRVKYAMLCVHNITLSIVTSNLALAPLEVIDLGDLEVGGVGGEQTGFGRLLGREAELGVDVQRDVGSAGRPDYGFDEKLVADEVVSCLGSVEIGRQSGLRLLAGEVVGCDLLACDSIIEVLKPTIVGGEEGVLEAIGIMDI